MKRNVQFSNFDDEFVDTKSRLGIELCGSNVGLQPNWMLMEVIIIRLLYRFLISSNDIFMVIGSAGNFMRNAFGYKQMSSPLRNFHRL